MSALVDMSCDNFVLAIVAYRISPFAHHCRCEREALSPATVAVAVHSVAAALATAVGAPQ